MNDPASTQEATALRGERDRLAAENERLRDSMRRANRFAKAGGAENEQLIAERDKLAAHLDALIAWFDHQGRDLAVVENARAALGEADHVSHTAIQSGDSQTEGDLLYWYERAKSAEAHREKLEAERDRYRIAAEQYHAVNQQLRAAIGLAAHDLEAHNWPRAAIIERLREALSPTEGTVNE